MYEGIPFCPECHSWPCACDDNIIVKKDGKRNNDDDS